MFTPLSVGVVSTSWDAPDNSIAYPSLGPGEVRGFPSDGQFDHDTGVDDGDPRQSVRARPRCATAEDPGAKHGTAQQCGDERRRSACWNLLTDENIGEFKIIHHCDGNPVRVVYLPVEQVQMGVDPSNSLIIWLGRHWPAPVMINSGIAAIAAARMITR